MTGKNSSSVPKPELLNGVIDTLKCEKVRSLLSSELVAICNSKSVCYTAFSRVNITCRISAGLTLSS